MTQKFLLALYLVSGATGAYAQIQESPRPSYSLRMNQVESGTRNFTLLSSGAPYPLNRRYENFTSDEKRILRSYYEGMLDTDDPPFPVAGMRDIVAEISKLVGRFQANGNLNIIVSINEKGDATAAKLLAYPSVELAKAVAFILIKEKYKPASCGGQPCALDFPFLFKVSTD